MRDASFAVGELGLRFLDELAARVEIRTDLLVAACSPVDLGRAPRDGLVEQPFAVGERLPGLPELVLLIRHSDNHDANASPQEPDLQRVYLYMGGLLASVVLALAATSPAQAAPNLGCGAGKLVLNVTYGVQNDVDTGIKGNNWAFDSYTRTVRVWRKGAGRFCSASTFADGRFTSIQGWSPGGKVQLPAGVRGTFSGSSVTTFRGTLARHGAPLHGFLGAKDFACTSADVKGQCSGTYDWLRSYFTGIAAFGYVRYEFRYHATEN